jgi:peptide deformylase
VPDRGGKVKRAKYIKVNAQDRCGKPFTLNINGQEAIVFQHEIDHLNGILFTDIMSEEVRKEESAEGEKDHMAGKGKK